MRFVRIWELGLVNHGMNCIGLALIFDLLMQLKLGDLWLLMVECYR